MLMTADKHTYLFSPCSHPHSFFPSLFTCFARRKFYFFVLFVALIMADVAELRLVPNRSGSMSLVHEGRAYKLRHTGKQKKHWACSKDKKGCGGAIWTNLDVTTVIKQNDHIKNCPVDEHLAYKMEKKAILKKRSSEETKPIPAIYDEEASAASTVPSTFGHFPPFKRQWFSKCGSRPTGGS
ncbi:hypothetical protein T10_3710 [Trichinella papuae]|uniref:FLYWCH-type domain-containing protein n=1 Tax=Trichinella papuae TaxID=268474 RepID=A0A0V1MV73_9BILA|nr:hypothetical protein T10_3710 [Trichinella papuae]